MNEGINTFRNLMLTDKDFQQKLRNAMNSYNGVQTEKAIFETVLVPLAAGYGITGTYEEFREFIDADREMDSIELSMVAGGKAGEAGVNSCYAVGIGAGVGGDGASVACYMVGSTR